MAFHWTQTPDLQVTLTLLVTVFYLALCAWDQWTDHRAVKIISTCFSWWPNQMETFPRYWPYVWGILRSPVNSPHKGQWRGALMISLICAWTNSWANNQDDGDFNMLGVGSANGGRHYVAPIGWSHTQNDPCQPYITVLSLCENFIIVLHTIVDIFNDLYCISICKLNRLIVYLSETPRYFGPCYRDTPPDLGRPPSAGPTPRMIPVIPISLHYCVAYYYVYFQ